ncbi:hypothetical protein G5C51_31630 [Streptomyces sp. A7024]|uniref:Uncharacterized protein n=1 Tax=Streptomyces coryli TaxID=1128680 RepID=A0A6G4U869_9ACTN|nr:hypothetical protein [Streptomyces coryli]NGN68435.1 hypothetical protein [Streptomyces coryli]
MTADGILCTVIDPDASIDLLVSAIEELLTADQCPNPEYARHEAGQKAAEALSAYRDAVGAGITPKQSDGALLWRGWIR